MKINDKFRQKEKKTKECEGKLRNLNWMTIRQVI